MKRLAITIAVLIVALYTPAFSDNSVATQINNGSKLLLKAGSDSLFYVYWVSGTGVKYARSEGGGSWSEETVVSIRDCPAIAADSTGKRWIAVRQNAVGEGDQDVVQEVYYRDGQSWVAETLYSVQIGNNNSFGPPSIAGASSTTTGIIYVAFLNTVTGGSPGKHLILTKFDGATAASCTVATGGSLGDPAVTVEPYKTDSDHVYVTWENNNVIKYCMDTDGRSSEIADNWTAVGDVSNSMFAAHHPSINSRRDAIVVAWAQGSPPDVYARRRLSGIWGIQTNQSGTDDSSDYATIALGEATVVAWEEANSASDHDILGRVDFASSITIHNCDTISSYPHMTLQPDGLSLYLHTIWSEPEYAVGYNSIDLWAPAPEGPQSASSGPLLTKPSLAACLPNPFHGRTQISYALPAASNVSLGVYDATGRPVRTLASGHQTAGHYSVSWDARDAAGKQVPCGVYFYRLDTPGFVSMKQAVVTR
jgi:hypothetical protein